MNTYKQALENLLIQGGVEGLCLVLNSDIYSDLPTINIEGEKFERYKKIYSLILYNIRIALEIDQRMNPISDLIDRLDKFGLDIHLTPQMSELELQEAIGKLDAEKQKFLEVLKEVKSMEKESRRLVLAFARVCYRFNEYQAPLRFNLEFAQKDALGLSDHFQEAVDLL